MSEWKPIETVPRDGAFYELKRARRVERAKWVVVRGAGSGWADERGYWLTFAPVYWRKFAPPVTV